MCFFLSAILIAPFILHHFLSLVHSCCTSVVYLFNIHLLHFGLCEQHVSVCHILLDIVIVFFSNGIYHHTKTAR